MRIQFSLRSLIIMSLLAAIPIYVASGFYLERAQWQEMKERADTIERLVHTTRDKKLMEFEVFSRGWGDCSSFTTNGSSEWARFVRIYFHKSQQNMDSNRDLNFDKVEWAYLMKITCSRSHFKIEPLYIEYDNASENEMFLVELKKLCTEKHWQYTMTKVTKLSP